MKRARTKAGAPSSGPGPDSVPAPSMNTDGGQILTAIDAGSTAVAPTAQDAEHSERVPRQPSPPPEDLVDVADLVDVPVGKPVPVEPHAEWTPPSWEEVVRTHSARVYRLAYRLTGNQHDAEDLTQEVFVRVFRSLSTYTPGTFEGWLHRITTNLFLDLVRRRARIRFEGLGEDAAERMAGREPSPAQAYHDAHLDADVQRALDDLPPEFRAAVVLCDIEGLSYEEIAATMGVKLGTVRSRIHRGRAQLRASLEHRAPRPGHSLPGPTLEEAPKPPTGASRRRNKEE